MPEFNLFQLGSRHVQVTDEPVEGLVVDARDGLRARLGGSLEVAALVNHAKVGKGAGVQDATERPDEPGCFLPGLGRVGLGLLHLEGHAGTGLLRNDREAATSATDVVEHVFRVADDRPFCLAHVVLLRFHTHNLAC